MHDGVSLAVDCGFGNGLDYRAAGLGQQHLTQLAGRRNSAVTERARVGFLGGVVTGQLQGFVLVAPVNRPVANLCGLVLATHLNRNHTSLFVYARHPAASLGGPNAISSPIGIILPLLRAEPKGGSCIWCP
ncbi:hypothetical protein D9M68_791720 [compost metagenome]